MGGLSETRRKSESCIGESQLLSFSCPDLTFSWTRTIFEAYRHSMAPLRWKGCHQWKKGQLIHIIIKTYYCLLTKLPCNHLIEWYQTKISTRVRCRNLRLRKFRGKVEEAVAGRWKQWILLKIIIFMIIVCLHSLLSLRCLLYLASSQFCAAFVDWCGPQIIVRLEPSWSPSIVIHFDWKWIRFQNTSQKVCSRTKCRSAKS